MQLDEGAREWLTLIETRKKELDVNSNLLREALKRKARLKSAKALDKSNLVIAELGALKESAATYVAFETQLFFQNVFGILEGSPVALRQKSGAVSRTLLASDVTARQLADGTGVFTVAGDSLELDLIVGLPCPEYLLAHEASGQEFVVYG